jgi:hypothetical protein
VGVFALPIRGKQIMNKLLDGPRLGRKNDLPEDPASVVGALVMAPYAQALARPNAEYGLM